MPISTPRICVKKRGKEFFRSLRQGGPGRVADDRRRARPSLEVKHQKSADEQQPRGPRGQDALWRTQAFLNLHPTRRPRPPSLGRATTSNDIPRECSLLECRQSYMEVAASLLSPPPSCRHRKCACRVVRRFHGPNTIQETHS